MDKAKTTTLITLGIILALTQVIGIPLVWKQWVTALLSAGLIAWGLYLRHGTKNSTKVIDAPYDTRPHA